MVLFALSQAACSVGGLGGQSDVLSDQSMAVIQVSLNSPEITLENFRDRKLLIQVPPGNRNPELNWQTLYSKMPGEEPIEDQRPAEQQDTSAIGMVKKFVGGKSTKKTFARWKDDPAGLEKELDRRFTRAMRSILKNKALKAEFIAAGKAFGVDPILALGCMVGENTFNVTAFDDAGTYAVRYKIMADKWALRFRSTDVELTALVQLPQFEVCAAPMRAGGPHSEYWDCVGAVWAKTFHGKTVDGVKYPAQGFKWLFFNPLGTGYSYGLGQLDPIRALMVTDMVHRNSGLRLLTIERPEEIYEDIIRPQSTIHYVMANVRLMVDRYAQHAGFDISQNPGVIASLYNLGGEKARANSLYRKNLLSLKTGVPTPPVENYYGFYVNEKEALMRQAFERWAL